MHIYAYRHTQACTYISINNYMYIWQNTKLGHIKMTRTTDIVSSPACQDISVPYWSKTNMRQWQHSHVRCICKLYKDKWWCCSHILINIQQDTICCSLICRVQDFMWSYSNSVLKSSDSLSQYFFLSDKIVFLITLMLSWLIISSCSMYRQIW